MRDSKFKSCVNVKSYDLIVLRFDTLETSTEDEIIDHLDPSNTGYLQMSGLQVSYDLFGYPDPPTSIPGSEIYYRKKRFIK